MNNEELIRWATERVMNFQDVVLTPFGDWHVIDKDNKWFTFNPITNLNHTFMVRDKLVDMGYEVTITKPVGPKYQVQVCVDSHCILHDHDGWALLLAANKALETA